MDKATQRVFFALWPETSICTELAAVMSELQAKVSARWIVPENLHMTLAFIGEVNTEQLKDLSTVADTIESTQFEVRLDRLEHWRKPRVLCLTPSTSTPLLGQLTNDLATRLRAAGFTLENRHYLAHLTLARKVAQRPPNLRFEQAIVLQPTAFVLAASTPCPTGSQYTCLRSWTIG